MVRGLTVTWLCLALTSLARAGETAPRFTKKPEAAKEGDRVRIEFSVDKETDVSVFIENARGEIIRHLAAGVLGKNAPAPLKPNSLSQTIVWDGRGDAGEVAHGGPFAVRVGLGLNLAPDRILGDRRVTTIRALAVRPNGELYALGYVRNFHKGDGTPACQVLDRRGRYLRTIIPWPGDLPKERVAGFGAIDIAGQGSIPFVHHGENRSFYPYLREPDRGYAVVTRGGTLLFAAAAPDSGGYPRPGPIHVLRIDKDGGCPREGFLGAQLVRNGTGFPALALSPDEKTLYVTGLAKQGLVYRLAMPEAKEAQVFAKGLDNPRGVAVDAQGNVFVAERGKNRIVAFKADGSILGEVAMDRPNGIAVHRKTGAIYALTGEYSSRLVKIAGLKSGAVVASLEFTPDRGTRKGEGRRPVFALDSEAEPAVVWVASLGGYGNWHLQRLEDAGATFAQAREVLPLGFPGQTADMSLDAARDVLYVRSRGGRYRTFDPKTGTWTRLPVVLPAETMTNGHTLICGGDGYLYLEVAGKEPETAKYTLSKGLYRYTRDLKPAPFENGADHVLIREGSLHMLARGCDVNARGEGVALVETRSQARRAVFHVLSFGPDGAVRREHLITGLPGAGTASVRIDNAGNVYVADASRPYGHVVRPEFKGLVPGSARLPNGRRNWYPAMWGTIIKFPPTGGAIGTGEGTKVTIGYGGDETTQVIRHGDTRKDVTLDFGGTATLSGALWQREAVSLVPLTRHTGGAYYCSCEQVRFDVDGFGRVFSPDTVRFQLVVLDTAGNLIGRFGTYGNVDSQMVGGGALRFAWPRLVAAGEGVVYVADDLSGTILRATIAYAVEGRAQVPSEEIPVPLEESIRACVAGVPQIVSQLIFRQHHPFRCPGIQPRRPTSSLASASRGGADGAQSALAAGSAASAGAGQQEDGLLDVRGQQRQVHDLADARGGDVGQACQFSVVGDLRPFPAFGRPGPQNPLPTRSESLLSDPLKVGEPVRLGARKGLGPWHGGHTHPTSMPCCPWPDFLILTGTVGSTDEWCVPPKCAHLSANGSADQGALKWSED